MKTNRLDREHDACGIGFVADAAGRSNRAIVAGALRGLANVKHRGAVASDARSGDGSGLLTPIPDAIFGGHGVITVFARGGDPRAAVEAAAAAEGVQVVEWRIPPTDDDHLGDLARASKPEILQAMIARPTDGGDRGSDADERVAYRLGRRISADAPEVYVASCSYRTVVY
jgi:glutamate synthase (NADPH/NADH) large chain